MNDEGETVETCERYLTSEKRRTGGEFPNGQWSVTSLV